MSQHFKINYDVVSDFQILPHCRSVRAVMHFTGRNVMLGSITMSLSGGINKHERCNDPGAKGWAGRVFSCKKVDQIWIRLLIARECLMVR